MKIMLNVIKTAQQKIDTFQHQMKVHAQTLAMYREREEKAKRSPVIFMVNFLFSNIQELIFISSIHLHQEVVNSLSLNLILSLIQVAPLATKIIKRNLSMITEKQSSPIARKIVAREKAPKGQVVVLMLVVEYLRQHHFHSKKLRQMSSSPHKKQRLLVQTQKINPRKSLQKKENPHSQSNHHPQRQQLKNLLDQLRQPQNHLPQLIMQPLKVLKHNQLQLNIERRQVFFGVIFVYRYNSCSTSHSFLNFCFEDQLYEIDPLS